MNALQAAVAEVLTFERWWGANWARDRLRAALLFVPPGVRINRRAELGSRRIALRDQIAALEKLSRRTPPKTLLIERARVEAAKVQVVERRRELADVERELRMLGASRPQETR